MSAGKDTSWTMRDSGGVPGGLSNADARRMAMQRVNPLYTWEGAPWLHPLVQSGVTADELEGLSPFALYQVWTAASRWSQVRNACHRHADTLPINNMHVHVLMAFMLITMYPASCLAHQRTAVPWLHKLQADWNKMLYSLVMQRAGYLEDPKPAADRVRCIKDSGGKKVLLVLALCGLGCLTINSVNGGDTKTGKLLHALAKKVRKPITQQPQPGLDAPFRHSV